MLLYALGVRRHVGLLISSCELWVEVSLVAGLQELQQAFVTLMLQFLVVKWKAWQLSYVASLALAVNRSAKQWSLRSSQNPQSSI